MFDFELLPNEMQLEILKRTEFRTVQSMKSVSKRVKKFLETYKKYMMPVPIRQMFVTPDTISFTLINSNEVCTLGPEHVDFFLNGARVDLLWVEAIGSEKEPISMLRDLIPSSIRVNCLKLGSSKIECDTFQLTALMDLVKCSELIVDWRFRIPDGFFEDVQIQKLSALTIGGQNVIRSITGEQFRKFHGHWLEIGPNRLTTHDLKTLLEDWKTFRIPFIEQFNIVISFPIPELLQFLKNSTRQETGTRWGIGREFEGREEQLEVIFFPNTNFSRNPSLVMRQFTRERIL